MKKLKMLIINGPNLNMLGTREKNIYGNVNLDDVNKMVKEEAGRIGVEVFFFQSNSEGEIVDKIQQAYDKFDGIIINPGAYSHYSIAIRDAISAVEIPTVEVHLSNIYSREEFRHKSVVSPVCIGQISGFKEYGYILALFALKRYIK